MNFTEICPCDNCELAYKCGEDELACRAFSSFVLRGVFDENRIRMPSNQLFQKVFKEDDKALKNYLKALQAKTGQNDLFE
jgi:hypothetical protein